MSGKKIVLFGVIFSLLIPVVAQKKAASSASSRTPTTTKSVEAKNAVDELKKNPNPKNETLIVYNEDFEKGEELFQLNKPAEAIVYFEKSLEKENIDPNVYVYLGVCYYQIENYDKSLAVCVQGLAKEGTDKKILAYNAGNACYAMGNYMRADSSYALALKEDENYSPAVLNRANAQLKLDRLGDARVNYIRYLELEPETPQRERIEIIIRLLEDEIALRAKERPELIQQDAFVENEKMEVPVPFEKVNEEVPLERASAVAVTPGASNELVKEEARAPILPEVAVQKDAGEKVLENSEPLPVPENPPETQVAVKKSSGERLNSELVRDSDEQARFAEENRLALEAEKARLAEEARKEIEAEKARLAEEAKKAAEAEAARLAAEEAERRRSEENRLALEVEKARLAEEARLALEAEKARLAEEARKSAELEIARLAAEEAKKSLEAEKARLAEEARKNAELEEARRALEAEKARFAEESKKELEAERARLAAEEARLALEAEKARLAEEARKEIEAERARIAAEENERRKAEEAEKARVAAEESEKRRVEEARLALEAEKLRQAEEARKAAEEEAAQIRAEETEKARLAEEIRKAEEAEKSRLAEEARKAEEERLAEEARKAAEEEAARLAEQKAQEEARKKEIASWPKAEAKLSVTGSENFTPDGDKQNDSVMFMPSINYLEENPESWSLAILDPRGNLFRAMSGAGALPSSIEWDGTSESGEIVLSKNTYTARLSVMPSKKDRERLGSKPLEASAEIHTGLLLEVIIPGHEWKMVVNSINFVPNGGLTGNLTSAQKKSNYETLDEIAEQIKDHPGAKVVIVEGYANNVSGTEKENQEELMPLSQLRADAIIEELVKRGVNPDVLQASGKGGANPLASQEDRENWWKNRRVEFRIQQ